MKPSRPTRTSVAPTTRQNSWAVVRWLTRPPSPAGTGVNKSVYPASAVRFATRLT
jgi:hypothetical protein